MGIAFSVAQERPAVLLPGRAGTVRWRSGGRGDLGVLEGVQEPVSGFFAEHVRGTRLDGGIVALAVGTGGDDDGNVGTDEVDLLNDGVAGDVVERACLEPAHLDDEGVAAFGPAAVDVDEVSAGEGGLRIGELLGAVMVPGCFRVGKELADRLFVVRLGGGAVGLGREAEGRCREKKAKREGYGSHRFLEVYTQRWDDWCLFSFER